MSACRRRLRLTQALAGTFCGYMRLPAVAPEPIETAAGAAGDELHGGPEPQSLAGEPRNQGLSDTESGGLLPAGSPSMLPSPLLRGLRRKGNVQKMATFRRSQACWPKAMLSLRLRRERPPPRPPVPKHPGGSRGPQRASIPARPKCSGAKLPAGLFLSPERPAARKSCRRKAPASGGSGALPREPGKAHHGGRGPRGGPEEEA